MWLAAFASLLLAAMVVSFGAGVWASPYLRGQADLPAAPSDVSPDLAPFLRAWSLVDEAFVFRDAVDGRRMAYGAIRGMLATLGDEGHTRFLSPEDRKVEENSLSGRFEGIGAEVGTRDGQATIVAPIEDSPAERAGLRAGDVIVEVDGVDVAKMALGDVVALIRGPRGAAVRLGIRRPGQADPLRFVIVRDVIAVQMVTWAMVPGTSVAHVRIAQFGQGTDVELRRAIRGAQAEGAVALVVDVRSNPGGLLGEAVAVASEFMDEGVVLWQEDRDGQRTPLRVRRGGLAVDLPIVVLADQGTASAAEILSGAMQDNVRARVVGVSTFGTGTVLTPYPLGDGSAILLGTSQWLTPDGRAIRKRGIRPDLPVPLPADAEMLTPRRERSLSDEQVRQSGDVQLLTALDLIESHQTRPALPRRGRVAVAVAE